MSKSGYKPKLDQWVCPQPANTANQHQLKRGIRTTTKAPCLALAGTGRRAGRSTCSLPSQPDGHEKTVYTHVGCCVLLAACLTFPVANHRRGNKFQGNKHQEWVISNRQLKLLREALDLHTLSCSLIHPSLNHEFGYSRNTKDSPV